MAVLVTEMMETAQKLSAERGHRVGLAGPALSDRVAPDGRLYTSARTLVPPLLTALEWLGFPVTPSFAWSHHNFWDIERGVALPEGPANSPACCAAGGGAGADPPTRGLDDRGRRPPGFARGGDLTNQAELLGDAWARASALPAVELLSNYLMYADPTADCGLCNEIAVGGTPRPVWDVFKGFPGVGWAP